MPLVPSEIESGSPLPTLSVATLLGAKPIPETIISGWEALGGFPEPFLNLPAFVAVIRFQGITPQKIKNYFIVVDIEADQVDSGHEKSQST